MDGVICRPTVDRVAHDSLFGLVYFDVQPMLPAHSKTNVGRLCFRITHIISYEVNKVLIFSQFFNCRCHSHTMCRSFFHNWILRQCLYTLFVDSLVDKADWDRNRIGWRRFTRPMWTLEQNTIGKWNNYFRDSNSRFWQEVITISAYA